MRTGLLAALALAFLIAGTGCSNNKTSAERDSLLKQNDDLKRQLDAEKAKSTDAENRANAAAAQTSPPAGEAVAPGMEGAPMDLSQGMSPGPAQGRGTAGRGTPSAAGRGGRGATPEISGVSSSTSGGEVRFEIAGDILFDSGKASLKPAAKKTLDGVAGTLKSKYSGQEIRVEGYTDPAPVKNSGWDDNYDLGFARANAVRAYLETKGVKNMYPASFGATHLKSSKNMALNRRVDIVVVKKAG